MARVLYGIHGTGHGHAMRGLTIARKLRQHEFLFVCNDDAPKVLEPEFRVSRFPNLGTVFHDYKVDIQQTILKAIPILWHREKFHKALLSVIDEFRPDVCMTDLEYFVPRAAAAVGLPCLTLDHQHVLTCCKHDLPADMWWDAFFQGLTPRYLFSPTRQNLIISFYAPPVLPRYRAIIAPPILRDSVLDLKPRDDGHVLVYQSNSTDERLVSFLRTATRRTCYVFGYGRTEGQDGNVVFMPKSEDGFLSLLESCAYVIQGGSHTLMGEALHLGKPIISLPIRAMVEQRFNALYLEKLGYGIQTSMAGLCPALLADFEARLPEFRARIATGSFCGNDTVFAMVDQFIRTGSLPGLPG